MKKRTRKPSVICEKNIPRETFLRGKSRYSPKKIWGGGKRGGGGGGEVASNASFHEKKCKETAVVGTTVGKGRNAAACRRQKNVGSRQIQKVHMGRQHERSWLSRPEFRSETKRRLPARHPGPQYKRKKNPGKKIAVFSVWSGKCHHSPRA